MSTTVRARTTSSRGRGAMPRRAAGIAVAGVLAATIALLASPSPLVPAARAAEPWTMHRVELPDDMPQGPLEAIIAGGPGYIAVGTAYTEDAETAIPVILTSVDGWTWEQAMLDDDAARGAILDVAAFAGGYAAVGSDTIGDEEEAAVVWLSEDGIEWRRIVVEGRSSPGGLSSVTAWQDGLFALGCASHEPEMCATNAGWTSPDGETWTRAGRIGKAGWLYGSVVSGFDHLFVVGVTEGYGGGVIVTSPDARRWEPYTVDGTSMLEGVETVEDGVIAVGTKFTDDPDPDPDSTGSWGIPNGLVLYSADAGTTWEEFPLTSPAEGATFQGVSVGPGEPVAYGRTGGGQPGAWLLSEEDEWYQVPGDGSTGSDEGWFSDMVPTADGSGAIGAGQIGPGYYDDQPAIWVIGPGSPPDDPAGATQ